MTPDWLRPARAAEHFGISERELARWADDGLIGRSQVGRKVWYRAQDVASVIARGETPRRVIPIEQPTPVAVDQTWRDDELWRGVLP